jgi:hypothetical protein
VTVEEARAQRITALDKANKVRLAKAELKRKIGADPTGDMLASVFEGSHGDAGAAFRVLEALKCGRRVGDAKAKRMLRAAGVFAGGTGADSRVGDLTERQAAVLATTVRDYMGDPIRARQREEARRRRQGALARAIV